MTQGEITVAFKTVSELYKAKGVPYMVSKRLYDLKRRLQPHFEFQREKELDLLEEWDAINPDGTLRITSENVNQINAKLNEIQNMEVDWQEPPVSILLNDDLAEKLGITGEILEKLEGFVDFEEMEGDE